MDNINKAYKELWIILEKFDGKDFNKISSEVIEMIKNNMDNDYEFELDNSVILSEQNLLPETKALLYYIYMNYLATDEDKKEIKKEEYDKIVKLENAKKIRYGTQVFKKNKAN